MLQPTFTKNDTKARIIIYGVSIIVFTAVVILSRVTLQVDLGFDVHLFAVTNAIINSMVAVLLIVALMAVKQRRYVLHKRIMLTAIVLSVLFLVSYIAHHLFAGETKFGDINHDGILNKEETNLVGNTLIIYRALLFTHIPLAGIILPFILFTAYRALIGEYGKHKKSVRWVFFAALGGPLP